MTLSLSLCLTPFAPGAAGASLEDRARRWMVIWSAPPLNAMAEIASRLRCHPSRLTIHQGAGPPHDHDDIEIRGPATGFAEPQVLALVADGATAEQLRAALAALQAALSRQTPRAA